MAQESPKTLIEQPTDYTISQKAHEESWKLRHDTYKHLTTLNTGSILLLVTFLEKIFTRPIGKLLVIMTFGSFLVSILASFMVMNIITSLVRDMEASETEDSINTVIIWVALASFLVGILCLVIFASVNLYLGDRSNPGMNLEIRLTSEGFNNGLDLSPDKPEKLP